MASLFTKTAGGAGYTYNPVGQQLQRSITPPSSVFNYNRVSAGQPASKPIFTKPTAQPVTNPLLRTQQQQPQQQFTGGGSVAGVPTGGDFYSQGAEQIPGAP